MKILKFLVPFMILFFALAPAQGQMEKGSIQLGFRQIPSLGFSSGGNLRFSFQPNIGYFVTDRLVLGANPIFSYAKTSWEGDGRQMNITYGGEAYGRYYFLNGRFRLFGEMKTGISWAYERKENDNQNVISTSTSGPETFAGAGLGVSYSLGKNIALELTVPFMSLQSQPGGGSTFNFRPTTPRIGIQFFLK